MQRRRALIMRVNDKSRVIHTVRVAVVVAAASGDRVVTVFAGASTRAPTVCK
jgi:hypothetical protein